MYKISKQLTLSIQEVVDGYFMAFVLLIVMDRSVSEDTFAMRLRAITHVFLTECLNMLGNASTLLLKHIRQTSLDYV